ncbi:MAG: precorrin-8X methylmutase [Planctomycetota bacterium]|jgi:precorrin-8X/cobalt-precorrin-8 methylmutase|nr:precorrin-8X methylmutase [Planctomycetota bacterium]
MDQQHAIVLLGHGGHDSEANAAFFPLAERLTLRLGAAVTPAFLAAQPGLVETARTLYDAGARSFLVLPYFLRAGRHVLRDLPRLIGVCADHLPDAVFETLPSLQDDPAVEDALLDRLIDRIGSGAPPHSAADIEKRSYEIIAAALGRAADGSAADAVARRVVHATGDLSFARSLLVRPGAPEAGIAALSAGKNVFVDVRMLSAGITRVDAARIGFGIADPDVVEKAKGENSTRAAAAVEKYADFWAGGIIAVGNAPTAIWRLLELCGGGARLPALVVGLPVGFVGAAEAKAALWDSGLPAITNRGRRGGSPAAAAAVNALALLADMDR